MNDFEKALKTVTLLEYMRRLQSFTCSELQ
jgi:hypothetical protein